MNNWFEETLKNSIETDTKTLNELENEYKQLKSLNISDPEHKKMQEEGIAFYKERIRFLKKRLKHNKKIINTEN